MKSFRKELWFELPRRRQLVNITPGVEAALHESGIADCALQPESTSDGMGVCFVEPAKFDVVQRGQKIAGAAQRRAKAGFLHQGTVQPLKVPEDFGAAFARQLAHEVRLVAQTEAEAALMAVAEDLVQRKYGSAEWTRHRAVIELLSPA